MSRSDRRRAANTPSSLNSSYTRTIIGIELSPRFIRGVRTGRNIRTILQPVESGNERAALTSALKHLGSTGSDASIRIVLRGMPLATTRLLPIPPEEVSSVSEFIPIPVREAAWEALPFGEDRTILLGAGRTQVEETLDAWGITPTANIVVEAVGLTTTALLALEPEIIGDGNMLWTERGRALIFIRSQAKIIEVGFHATDQAAKFIVGEGAVDYSRNNTGAITFRPGGLEPDFAIAWGATRWGTEYFPHLPNLEPKDRRDYRRKNHLARKMQRIATAASIIMLAAAGAIQIPIAFAQNSATAEQEAAATRTAESAAEWTRLRQELAKRMPSAPGPADAIEAILKAAASFSSVLRITELHTERAPAAYAAIASGNTRSSNDAFTITGQAMKLDTVEALRDALNAAGYSARVEIAQMTDRPGYSVDFRIKIP